jgi:hypothetical protein
MPLVGDRAAQLICHIFDARGKLLVPSTARTIRGSDDLHAVCVDERVANGGE